MIAAWPGLILRKLMRASSVLAGVNKGGGSIKLFNNTLSQFSTFPTFAGNPQFGPEITHITGTITTKVANLVVSNLSANAHVHGLSSIGRIL